MWLPPLHRFHRGKECFDSPLRQTRAFDPAPGSRGWLGTGRLAQAPPRPHRRPAHRFALVSLRPALANVQTAIGSLSVAHWKASSETRAAIQQDVASMQRDLTTTLPGLVSQAEAAGANGPAALSPAFAVFRNLDALYDVLLRVTETAALAGPASDAEQP